MKWSPFATSTWTMLSFLEAGTDGHGRWALHSSKNGLRVTLNGLTMGRGTDPDELMKDYEANVARMRQTAESHGK